MEDKTTPKQRPRKATQAQKDHIVRLWNKGGLTADQIADVVGCGRNAATKHRPRALRIREGRKEMASALTPRLSVAQQRERREALCR